MPQPRQTPWLMDRAAVLQSKLATHGLTVSDCTAAEIVYEHVGHLAEVMGLSRRSVKPHLTDETITNLAARIADDYRNDITNPSRAHPANGV